MANDFLSAVDHWILSILRERMTSDAAASHAGHVSATDLALLISDYVLQRVAAEPNSCWSACDIDHASDAEILAATTFDEDLLAAAFIGAVCELSRWCGDEGLALMTENGVPPEDAVEIAAAVDVVTGKLGARGQALIHRVSEVAMTSHVPSAEEALVAH